jgi:hypothetical protein
MVTESVPDRPKSVMTSYQNGAGQLVAWCIRRATLVFCAVGVLVIVHLIQQMELTTGQSKIFRMHRFLAEKSPLPARKKDEIIAESLPSLPYVAWKAYKDKRWNLKCGQYPYIYDVSFFNTYWQTFKLQNYTVQIFGKDKNPRICFTVLF